MGRIYTGPSRERRVEVWYEVIRCWFNHNTDDEEGSPTKTSKGVFLTRTRAVSVGEGVKKKWRQMSKKDFENFGHNTRGGFYIKSHMVVISPSGATGRPLSSRILRLTR